MGIANVNTVTGIAYGVIQGNSVHYLMEDIFQNGTDLSLEKYKAQCIKELASVLEEHGQRNAEDTAVDIVDNYEWDDYQYDEAEYEYEDNKGNQFRMGYLGGAPLIWCIKTDTIVHARQCSPCVPNAGDLDNLDAGGITCYGVPKEYLDADDTDTHEQTAEPFDGAAGDGSLTR